MGLFQYIIDLFSPKPAPKPFTPEIVDEKVLKFINTLDDAPRMYTIPSVDVAALLTLHNHERASISSIKLNPLKLNAKLNVAAQGHANWMAAHNRLDHSESGVTFDKRLSAAGYHFWMAGENIAMGQPTPQAVMQAWMNSPGHRANILKPGYKDVGFGIAEANGRYWWCVDFGSQAQGLGEEHPIFLSEPGVFLSGPLGPEVEKPATDHLT